MPRNVVEFTANCPVELALKYHAGKIMETRFGKRVMYSLFDGRVMFHDLTFAERINNLALEPGETFFVCCKWTGDQREWDCWLSPATEKARARAEMDSAEEAPDSEELALREKLQDSIICVQMQKERARVTACSTSPLSRETGGPESHPIPQPHSKQIPIAPLPASKFGPKSVSSAQPVTISPRAKLPLGQTAVRRRVRGILDCSRPSRRAFGKDAFAGRGKHSPRFARYRGNRHEHVHRGWAQGLLDLDSGRDADGMTRHLRRYLAYAILDRIDHPRAERREWNGRGPARDWRYRAWIRTLPCLVCGRTGADAAHTGSDGGMSLKASDYSCVSLCREHHTMRSDSYHYLGRGAFERRHCLNLVQTVKVLNVQWREGKCK